MSIFSHVQVPNIRRSVFNLSYPNAFTCRFGEIIPAYVEEFMAGEKVKLAGLPYVNLQPLSAPILGNIKVDVHYFFVPYRIVWKNWEKFYTGGKDGLAKPAMPFDALTGGTLNVSFSHLFDYLSKSRTNFSSSDKTKKVNIHPKVNALDWRSYWLIYNEYYRDENLEKDLFDDSESNYISIDADGDISKAPGYSSVIDGKNLFSPAFACWKKDLFTSALPFAQRGAPVTIPSISQNVVAEVNGEFYPYVQAHFDTNHPGEIASDSGITPNALGTLKTSEAASFSIEELRYASALQRWLERNAIAGGRYKEQILAHFGYEIRDYRVQRPEFIGGVSTIISASTVYQNSQTTNDSVLGTRGGYASGSAVMRPCRYTVPEPGLIMGMFIVRPERGYYSQGIHRRSLKFDKMDYYSPEFQSLGEQQIYNAELYAVADTADMKEFGYGPRYYEYKQRMPEVHGDFRTNLAYWLPQRVFSSPPALNQDFVHVDPSKDGGLNNIFAITDPNVAPFQCVLHNAVKAVRPLSKYSKFSFS